MPTVPNEIKCRIEHKDKFVFRSFLYQNTTDRKKYIKYFSFADGRLVCASIVLYYLFQPHILQCTYQSIIVFRHNCPKAKLFFTSVHKNTARSPTRSKTSIKY